MDTIFLPSSLDLMRSSPQLFLPPPPPPPRTRVIQGKTYTEHELERLRDHCKTVTQVAIFDLMVNGLNIFSVPYGQKGGSRWSQMQYTALDLDQIPNTFIARCNLAVMMGCTSGNLFTLDAETDPALKHFKHEFEKHGIPIVCQRSGKPGGGGHLFGRCAEGELANLTKNADRKDWELRCNRNYVLIAPSKHPSGSYYRWTEGDPSQIPTVSIEQLRWLGAELCSVRAKRRPHQSVVHLCNTSQKFIRDGAPEGERNDTLYKTGCDMNGCGYSRHDAGTQAGAAAHRSGLDWPEINATLDSAYKEPRTPSRQYAAQTERAPLWVEALILGLERKWEGVTANSDRAAYISAVLRSRTASVNGVFRAACREIAEIGHLNKDTAAEAINRLEDMGYLRFEGQDRSSQAYLYSLNMTRIRAEQRDLHNSDTLLAPSWGEGDVRFLQNLLATDVVERGALNWSGLILYVNMVRVKEPKKVAELAQIANLSPAQVYRAMTKLKEANLAVKIEGTHTYQAIWVEPEMVDERVSVPCGTFGRSQRRREQHIQDRKRRAARMLREDLRRALKRRRRSAYPARYNPAASAVTRTPSSSASGK